MRVCTLASAFLVVGYSWRGPSTCWHLSAVSSPRRVAHGLGFTEEQIGAGMVVDSIGNTYAGSSLLGLAAVLDVAQPGDRIFFCSYGSGAGSDAFSLVANGRLAAARAHAPLVHDYLDRSHDIHDYGEYLRLSRKIRLL